VQIRANPVNPAFLAIARPIHRTPVWCLTSLWIILIATGCASGPKFTAARTPAADRALVYIYRPSCQPWGLSPTIYINSVKTAKLTNKGYFDLELKPGIYLVKADWSWNSQVKDGIMFVPVDAGKVYFIRVTSEVLSFTIFPLNPYGSIVPNRSGGVMPTDDKTAYAEIVHCGLVEKYPGAADKIPPGFHFTNQSHTNSTPP